jgi:hypothetical protein
MANAVTTFSNVAAPRLTLAGLLGLGIHVNTNVEKGHPGVVKLNDCMLLGYHHIDL